MIWFKLENFPDYSISETALIRRDTPGKSTYIGRIVKPTKCGQVRLRNLYGNYAWVRPAALLKNIAHCPATEDCWEPAFGFPGYAVSATGAVMRTKPTRCGKAGSIIPSNIGRDGAPYVMLFRDGKTQKALISQLSNTSASSACQFSSEAEDNTAGVGEADACPSKTYSGPLGLRVRIRLEASQSDKTVDIEVRDDGVHLTVTRNANG